MRKFFFPRSERRPQPRRPFVSLERLEDRSVPALFTPLTAQTFSGLNNNSNVAIGDFNHDGKPDLVVSNYGQGAGSEGASITVLFGQGNGKFTLSNTYSTGSSTDQVGFVAVGDLNGDGFDDIVSCQLSSSNNDGSYTVFINNGSGAFTKSATDVSSGGNFASWVGIADFNGDGIPDLAFTNTGVGVDDGSGTGTQTITNNNVTFLKGNNNGSGKGTGTFSPLSTVTNGTNFIPTAATIADFTGDGHPDLAVVYPDNTSNTTDGHVVILTNNGVGNFSFGTVFDSGGALPISVATGDFNLDGKADVVVANAGDPDQANSYANFGNNSSVAVLSGVGNGTLNAGPVYGVGTAGLVSAFGVAVGDFNMDGYPDIAVANYGSPTGTNGSVIALIGDGSLNFAADANSPYTETGSFSGAGVQYVAVADFDGKGNPDIVSVGNQNFGISNLVSDFLNTTKPTATSLQASSTNAASGTNITFTATVSYTNGFTGNPTGSVNFYDGTTLLGSGTLSLVGSAEQATYSTTALAVGNHNITAKYTGQYGSSPFTGVSTSAVTPVTITGTGNTPPTIGPILDATILPPGGVALSFTIGDAETPLNSLILSRTSSNLSVIPLANIFFSGTGASRGVQVNGNGVIGQSTITVTVTDGGGLTASSSFVITVVADTPPTISSVSNQTVIAGNSTGNLAFTVNDAETDPNFLTVTATSSNTGLIPNGAITLGGSGTNRTVNVQSTAATSGTSTITLSVTDGGGNTTSTTFTVTVNAPNTPPTITTVGDQSVIAGSSTGNLSFTVGDAQTPAGSLTVTATSSNTSLIPNNAITLGGSGANRTVNVQSTASTTGSTTITLTVTDGGGLTATSTFNVQVNANTPPSITDIPDQTVTAGNTVGPINFLIGDNETAANLLTLTVTTSNPALIPASAVTFGGSGGNRTVTVNTIAGFNGSTTLTVTVHDANGGTASDQFIVTQTVPANTPPIISDIPDQSVTAGSSVGPVSFSVSDAETPANNLTVSAKSSNGAVIPVGNVTFGGSGTNRTVTVAAPAGVTGTSTITVTVTDGGGLTDSDTFVITVNPVPNTPPTIGSIANKTVNAGSATGALSFIVGDAETPTASLTVTAASSNPTLIPLGNITLGGSGANRTVNVASTAGTSGTSTITLTVTDGGGLTAQKSFTVTVIANTPPTISTITDQTTPQDTAIGPIAFTIGDAETPLAGLTVSAASSNTALVFVGNIVFGGSGANRTLTITPAAGQNGTSTITVTVTDGGGLTASDSFVLTVNPTPPGRAHEFAVASDAGLSSAVRFFNPDRTERYTLQPFGVDFTGGIRTASADFTGDDVADLVVASGPGMPGEVKIFDGVTQNVIFDMQPFGATFTRGIVVSAGDMTHDGKAELVITAESGGGARVRIFSPTNTGFVQLADFIALIGGDGKPDTNFRGGGRSAVGDFNGDGYGDLAFAAGTGGGPRIAIFDGKSLGNGSTVKMRGDFFAFEPNLRNGTYISAGDLDGDGRAELFAGAGPGGGPRVSIFSGSALMQGQELKLKDFFAGDISNRGGIRVAVKNLDGDNNADLLVGAGPGGGSRATAYSGADLLASSNPPPTPTFAFDAFPGFSGGVYVG